MKKTLATTAMLMAVGALALSGCSGGGGGQSGAAASGDALEFYFHSTAGSPQNAEMEKLAQKFTEETGTKVNINIDSGNFENNIKVRMASNSLPDVFSTHGWSLLRYSPYLEPLTDRAWAKDVNKGLDDSMRDAEGNIFALPLEFTVTGILANFDVLDEAGVDPDSLKTWDDFDAALAKIKTAGKIGMSVAGKEDGPAGDMSNFIASNAFSEAQLKDFQDGTFDSDAFQKNVYDKLQAWRDAGYFNPDYVSASQDDEAMQLAQGQAAFVFGQPYIVTTALSLNPEANVGFIPLPGTTADEQYLIGGEGVSTFGVWKDSPRKEQGLAFLDFLAEPENAKAYADATGLYPGLSNVEGDLGKLTPSYDKWVAPEKLPVKAFFDRVYLPNGMWSTLYTTSDAIISGQSDAAAATQQMADQFKTLYGQNQ